jgi:hypothetical protein
VAVSYDPMVPAHPRRPQGKFELVTCFETLEHLPNPVGGIALLAECMAEPGLAHITTFAQPGGSYRIELTGEPSYAMDICLSSRKGDHNHAGLVATAMRIVNAIPAVVAAPPGIVTTLDLPLVTGKGLYAPS